MSEESGCNVGWLMYNGFIEERGVVKMKVVMSLIVDKENGVLKFVVGEKGLNEGDKEVIGKFEDNVVLDCNKEVGVRYGSELRKFEMKLKDDNKEFDYKGWLKCFGKLENKVEKLLYEDKVVKVVRWSVEYDDCISVVVVE